VIPNSKNQRIAQHVIFWSLYTLLYALLNTAFSSPSDKVYTVGIRFLRFWLSEIGTLPLKLLLVYSFLYYIVPVYLLKQKYFKTVLALLIILVPVVTLYRLQLFHVMSPVMYGDYPGYNPLEFRRMFFTMIDLLSVLAIGSTAKLLKNRILSQQREQKLINEKLQSELSYLKGQVNPHFLFNTLNNIYALARKNAQNTPEVIMQLSKILRFMLYECNEPTISLSDEIRVMKDYVKLEKIRYNDRLKTSYTENIDHPGQEISPLLLLPLVENAFKHGVSNTRFDSFVNMNIELQNGVLNFNIENSKEGNHDEEIQDGIGLSNVKRQLELLYPDKYKLIINNESSRFVVELIINLNSDE